MRIIFICILSILFFGSCSDEKYYIVSPDGHYTLTYFEFNDNSGKAFSMIAYGRLEERSEIENFIITRNYWKDGWECLISWEGSKAIIYQGYGRFKGNNLEDKMELVDLKAREFYEIFYRKPQGHYYRLSSK